jgi:hypothetical protein
MEKVEFALNVEDDWPSVGAEGVWCERVNENYRLLNTPFFVKGLANGDVFSAVPDPVNHQIFEFEVVEMSGNSVVWMANIGSLDISKLCDDLESLNCRIEGLPQFSSYAIHVPPSIDLEAFDDLIGRWEILGLCFVYPTWRLEG